MFPPEVAPAEALVSFAEGKLVDEAPILEALKWCKENPDAVALRVGEFDGVLETYNTRFRGYSGIDENFYGWVAELKRRLTTHFRLPTIVRLVTKCNEAVTRREREAVSLVPLEAVKELNLRIASRTWMFREHLETYPEQLTALLLVSGYGLFLERFARKTDFDDTFVRGFCELLYTNHQDTVLMSDFIGVMREHSALFSPAVRSQLRGRVWPAGKPI